MGASIATEGKEDKVDGEGDEECLECRCNAEQSVEGRFGVESSGLFCRLAHCLDKPVRGVSSLPDEGRGKGGSGAGLPAA